MQGANLQRQLRAPRSGGQAGIAHRIAVVREVAFTLVVKDGGNGAAERESGISLQDFARVVPGGLLVARLRVAGREERVVELVRCGDALEGLDRLGVATRDEVGPPEVVPEARRMVGITSRVRRA